MVEENSDLIPGVKSTDEIDGELVIHYNISDASKATKSVDSLKQIVQENYRRVRSRKTSAYLQVLAPRALLVTDEGSKWTMVEWFKDDKTQLPGINELKMTAQGIKYEYNTCDWIAAEYTVTHLEEILKDVFTASSVDDFIGVQDEDDDGKMLAASTSDSKNDSGEE